MYDYCSCSSWWVVLPVLSTDGSQFPLVSQVVPGPALAFPQAFNYPIGSNVCLRSDRAVSQSIVNSVRSGYGGCLMSPPTNQTGPRRGRIWKNWAPGFPANLKVFGVYSLSRPDVS